MAEVSRVYEIEVNVNLIVQLKERLEALYNYISQVMIETYLAKGGYSNTKCASISTLIRSKSGIVYYL